MRQLSPRECQVLEALHMGQKFVEVAQSLNVSLGATLKTAARAYTKLGVHSHDDAIKRHRRLPGHQCYHQRVSIERAEGFGG